MADSDADHTTKWNRKRNLRHGHFCVNFDAAEHSSGWRQGCYLHRSCIEVIYKLYLLLFLLLTTANHDSRTLPSGGTLATALGIFDEYSIRKIADSAKPWALSPLQGPESKPDSFLTKLLGVRSVPELGVLTTGVSSIPNTAIVQRSWYLLDQGNYYGQHFTYKEYATARNHVVGMVIHLGLAFGMFALALPPVRWLVRKLVYQPGAGPARESTLKDRIDWRAVGTADSQESQKAFAKLAYTGSGYDLTGIFLAEAAIVILRDSCAAHDIGGGVLTPATLGQPYIERLQKAGVEIAAYLSND